MRSTLKEEWADIAGTNGSYRISNHGTITSTKTTRARALKQHARAEGHLSVCLYMGAQRLPERQVHRLVMQTFVGPCPEGMEVRHLDGNPANNRLDNLEYGTRKQNMEDSRNHGTIPRGEARPGALLTDELVREIRARHANGESYASIARTMAASSSVVRAAAIRRTWKHVD